MVGRIGREMRNRAHFPNGMCSCGLSVLSFLYLDQREGMKIRRSHQSSKKNSEFVNDSWPPIGRKKLHGWRGPCNRNVSNRYARNFIKNRLIQTSMPHAMIDRSNKSRVHASESFWLGPANSSSGPTGWNKTRCVLARTLWAQNIQQWLVADERTVWTEPYATNLTCSFVHDVLTWRHATCKPYTPRMAPWAPISKQGVKISKLSLFEYGFWLIRPVEATPLQTKIQLKYASIVAH